MKCLGKLTAGVSLALMVCGTASAKQSAPVIDLEPSTNSAQIRDAMKRDLGMTDAELSQYQEIERLAQSQLSTKSQDPGFAGSWIERTPDGVYQYVVASTSPQKKVGVAGMAVRKVAYSLAQLDTAKTDLDRVRNSVPAGVYGWGVDVSGNKVKVDVAPGAEQAAIDFVAASGADARTIRFDTMESAPKTLKTFYGGSEYLSQVDGQYYYCSVGFAVTRGQQRGFVTAGHCGTQGDTVHTYDNQILGPSFGSFQGSVFPHWTGDFGWVAISGHNSVMPIVDGYAWKDQPVTGTAVAPIGAVICRSGRTTGFRCGQVLAYNQVVNYSEGSIGGLTSVKVCAEGGDSGGSFINGFFQAQGVLSGGNYDCQGANAQLATSYFQPVNEILNYFGLTLTTY